MVTITITITVIIAVSLPELLRHCFEILDQLNFFFFCIQGNMVIIFIYLMATFFWCLFLIICFSYSFPHHFLVTCSHRYCTDSSFKLLSFDEASSYRTSLLQEIPMRRPAWVSDQQKQFTWSQSCVGGYFQTPPEIEKKRPREPVWFPLPFTWSDRDSVAQSARAVLPLREHGWLGTPCKHRQPLPPRSLLCRKAGRGPTTPQTHCLSNVRRGAAGPPEQLLGKEALRMSSR